MTRGVLYMVWGGERLLDRSLSSLKSVHPDLPYHVHRQAHGSLLDKAGMFDHSPFDTTLFLDADTVVLGELDFAFEQAEKHGIACCICESPWARRYPSISGDVVEYNTGVLAFSRTARPVFDEWKRLAREIDSSIIHTAKGQTSRMPCNDQASFAKAVYDLNFNPFVLPLNYNLRPEWQRSWFGEVKIWHDRRNVIPEVIQWNQHQSQDDAIIQYAGLS